MTVLKSPGFAFVLYFLLHSWSATGQPQAQADSTIVRFLDYHKKTPQEKVYIRTNKEVFSSGETVWFSSYILDASTHARSTLSKLLYVDLINPADEVISTLNIKSENGVGQGDFFMADSLSEGIYHIRAYTNYMMNFDEDFLFTKPIKLLDLSTKTVTEEMIPEVRDIDIQFFPEGGNIIANELNYIAFRATNESGNGVKIEGKIIDEEGAEAGSFRDMIFGMGKFLLKPEAGKRYFVSYEVRGVPFSKALPEIMDKGYLLNVRQTADKIYITAKGTGDIKIQDAFLIGHTRGLIFLALPGSPDKPFIYAPIPSAQIPSGIAHFALFDGDGKPQCERLVFNLNGAEMPDLEVVAENNPFSRREKTRFDLNLVDKQGVAIDGNISISVLSDLLNAENKIDIVNYLLLSSDLKGTIEHPEIYFDEGNPDRMKHLDLVMMTHGWRRFVWDDIRERSLPPIAYYPQTGFSIEGQVVKYLSRDKGVKGKVEFTFLENMLYKQEVNSLQDGTFWFDDLQIVDTVTAVIQTKRLKESKGGFREAKGGTYISIRERDIPDLRYQFLNPYDRDVEYTDFIDNSLKIRNIEAEFGDDIVVLEEIKVEAAKDYRSNPHYRESMLYQRPDDRLVLDSLVGMESYTNIFDLMNGKLPGVDIVGTYPEQTAIIRGYSSLLQSNEALFLVDGIPTDPTLVSQIPPQQVEFIDVLKGPQANIYSASGNGVIAIYRRTGPRQFDGDPDPVSFISFRMNGYYPAREFYVPKYDTMTDEEKVKPDYRTALYWNPSVSIKGGKASFDFYTSDDRGPFTIYAEGISSDGKIIKHKHTFEVK